MHNGLFWAKESLGHLDFEQRQYWLEYVLCIYIYKYYGTNLELWNAWSINVVRLYDSLGYLEYFVWHIMTRMTLDIIWYEYIYQYSVFDFVEF